VIPIICYSSLGMSHSRKHITLDSLQNFPTPSPDEKVVQVIELRGSNVCEIVHTNGDHVLCTIPKKFHKLIWIKKGNYLIVRNPPELANLGNRKIKAVVLHVLFPPQIKYLVKENLWPKEFQSNAKESHTKTTDLSGEEEEELEGSYNPNRQALSESSSSSEDSSEED